MWRPVQVWTGTLTALGEPFIPTAHRLHWHALLAWNACLLAHGVPLIDAARDIQPDETAPPLADAVWCLKYRRAHPTAQWAWHAAALPDFGAGRMPKHTGVNLCSAAYDWSGADANRFGRNIVDYALALSLAALTAWDELLHRAARAFGKPLPTIGQGGERYEVEPYPAEEFLDSVELRRRRKFDCEDAGTDRAAELRAAGVDARATFSRREFPRVVSSGPPHSVTLYHVLNRTPWGLEDWSRNLGMKG